MNTELNADFWQSRYQTGQTGWDLGEVSPPLKAYFQQLTDPRIRMLIPGCGNAYEAKFLHEQGFKNVFLADIAAAPLQEFILRVPDFPADHLLQADFFDLSGQYDLLIEQTFFCAIPPKRRPEYAKQAAKLLKPGGKLVGLLFDRTFPEPGPPFGGSLAEYRSYFEPYFHFRTFEPAYNSVTPRAGSELFIILEKKA